MGLDQARPETNSTVDFYVPKANKFPFLPLVGSSVTAHTQSSVFPGPGIMLRVDGSSSVAAWEILSDACLLQTEIVQEPNDGKWQGFLGQKLVLVILL